MICLEILNISNLNFSWPVRQPSNHSESWHSMQFQYHKQILPWFCHFFKSFFFPGYLCICWTAQARTHISVGLCLWLPISAKHLFPCFMSCHLIHKVNISFQSKQLLPMSCGSCVHFSKSHHTVLTRSFLSMSLLILLRSNALWDMAFTFQFSSYCGFHEFVLCRCQTDNFTSPQSVKF